MGLSRKHRSRRVALYGHFFFCQRFRNFESNLNASDEIGLHSMIKERWNLIIWLKVSHFDACFLYHLLLYYQQKIFQIFRDKLWALFTRQPCCRETEKALFYHPRSRSEKFGSEARQVRQSRQSYFSLSRQHGCRVNKAIVHVKGKG